MRNRVLVLEGVPASGKTSLANRLRDTYGAIKVNESLGVPAANSGNQKAIFRETVERYTYARSQTGLVVIDRGYPSLLAWDYCRERTGFSRDYSEKFKWVQQALAAGELFEPFFYIYLYGSTDVSFQRRPRQPLTADAWSDQRGVEDCIIYYDWFFSQLDRKDDTLHFDCLRTNEDIAAEIMDKIIT